VPTLFTAVYYCVHHAQEKHLSKNFVKLKKKIDLLLHRDILKTDREGQPVCNIILIITEKYGCLENTYALIKITRGVNEDVRGYDQRL
jgi:hypothetical protein